MPAPHLEGSWQVITPPCMDQPWASSVDLALAMLNAYGPWLLFWVWMDGIHWLPGGEFGAGPEPGMAYPGQIALMMPGWSMTSCRAWRMYSWRIRKPACGLLKLGWAYWMPNGDNCCRL